jgi:hypothetical protein
MAAADHLQPQQLSMFMSARDIASSYSSPFYERKKVRPKGEPSRLENDDEIMDRKLSESKKRDWGNLHSKLRKQGVQTPIDLTTEPDPVSGRPGIAEGNHRVAAMLDIDPDRLNPVLHHRTTGDVGNYWFDKS